MAWNEQKLEGEKYSFLIVDAVVINVLQKEAVRPTSKLIICGINKNNVREVLGLQLGDSETEATWRGLFQWLKRRGLVGVNVVVSDAHKGLVPTIQRSFQEAVWQRSQVHLLRNVLGHIPKHVRGVLAAFQKEPSLMLIMPGWYSSDSRVHNLPLSLRSCRGSPQGTQRRSLYGYR